MYLIRLENISKLGNATVGPDTEIKEFQASPVDSAGCCGFLGEVTQISETGKSTPGYILQRSSITGDILEGVPPTHTPC